MIAYLSGEFPTLDVLVMGIFGSLALLGVGLLYGSKVARY